MLWLERWWRATDPAWKFALGAYLLARAFLAVWSLVIAALFPIVLQNLDLFGSPVVAVFDLTTSERFAYSRMFDGKVLTFRLGDAGQIIDIDTNSTWSLKSGRAVSGVLNGRTLSASDYSVDEVFPYRGVELAHSILVTLWQRFDTNWYLAIAARGYSIDDGSTVYFPAYPFLIRTLSWLTGSPMFAALLVSNLALIGVLFLLYRMTESMLDTDSAKRTLVYLLIFPTGFFLLVAYTESLFLFFVLGTFYAAQRERWWLAVLFGALTALTRLQGVLMLLPLVYIFWRKFRTMPRPTPLMRYAIYGSSLLLIPVTTFGFLVLTNFSLLSSYEGQLHARFVFPWDNVLTCLALFQNGRGTFVDALNLLATLGFGAMLIVIWRRLPFEHTLYALGMYFAPLFRMTTEQPLVSMSRYAVVMFPVFMLWGVAGKQAWANRAILYLSFPLQLYLSAQFVLWGWVG